MKSTVYNIAMQACIIHVMTHYGLEKKQKGIHVPHDSTINEIIFCQFNPHIEDDQSVVGRLFSYISIPFNSWSRKLVDLTL